MSRLVVDADVVSFLFKNHPAAKLYDSELQGQTLLLSFMTLAELDRWVIQRNWSDARRNWLSRYLEPFVILPYDRALCAKWAEVTAAAQARGYRIECADAWIAASALIYNLPLVTHNRGDSRGVLRVDSYLARRIIAPSAKRLMLH
jgi:predicted nucleic acid-binding protein